ncbi:hypothetical protein L915_11936 [Phytophthora nicotianae]|uniref:Uncharacterized protein n=1 Tax=Phytophthora nicotianae TaxID=4792 RepID=W2GKD3_PHYNI|nr:hypothetical protein L915_11936 [Phytophthora nicotianae]ETM42638.1 hypothetical protein L914_11769 [Phytophthora nicotianae]
MKSIRTGRQRPVPVKLLLKKSYGKVMSAVGSQ